jgi:hypothetical protein
MHVSNVIRNLKIFRKIFRNWPCPLVTADSRPRKPGPAWSNPRYWGPPTRVSGEHEKTPHHHAGPTPRAVLPETRPVQCFYSFHSDANSQAHAHPLCTVVRCRVQQVHPRLRQPSGRPRRCRRCHGAAA